MMKDQIVDVLVGVQWGDEGKGKIIDVLTPEADMVVRFQGGNNAGHTVCDGKEKYVLHLVPSGILNKDAVCVIANGVVVDPIALKSEMESLAARGISLSNIQLSERAILIMPWHKLIDAYNEDSASKEKKIGTTLRGIGPAYMSKVERTGIRAGEMRCMERFEQAFRDGAEHYEKTYVALGAPKLNFEEAWTAVRSAAEYLRPYIVNTTATVNQARLAGKKILLEGAQGAFLDIDHGTFPFVTSSNTTSGGACTGTGVPPRGITCVWGVLKAYMTRVGAGPFPTELFDAQGDYLREKGGEFGATTGRPRRCGWLDIVACRYSCLVNGVDYLAVTKLDVLDGLDEIKICTAYRLDGRIIDEFPSDVRDLARVEPVYETVPGWKESSLSATKFDELPPNAQAYLRKIADMLSCKIGIVSVGPDRAQTFSLLDHCLQ